jgi:hypothetical protein
MPNVSFGARGLPLLLRPPGTGGRRRGTGDDMARLFCLSPGKNNSFGSARVATVSMLDTSALVSSEGVKKMDVLQETGMLCLRMDAKQDQKQKQRQMLKR